MNTRFHKGKDDTLHRRKTWCDFFDLVVKINHKYCTARGGNL
jgi:hypothetical protein